MLTYLFAFFIYNPYRWLHEKLEKDSYVKEIKYTPALRKKFHVKSYWGYWKDGKRVGSAQTKELAERALGEL